ncbi:hypothetical protein MHD_01985 [Mannheimia granulomatis]|uniref:Uncharacterized protein n=1 Tax=Mannheimia granulomatis TaxID=85402 RepID=A0A011MKD5_9PAST|nr:DUF2057 family protein [Mannheimia granulomatis]EXI62936.1 hypothetical protein AK33_00570 [Mannheimia granulomatis]RGE48738.1 hypothetical protein MHD_01985 [Mannheimia granulomatis]
MKLTKMAAALSALLISSMSVAGTLSSSHFVDILAFDGQRVKSGTKSVQISENKTHQVVVEVAGTVEGDFFNSDQIILTFQGSAENAVLEAPRLNSKLDLRKFNENQTVSIKTDSGKVISHKQDFLKGEGFLASTRVEENLSKYNLGKHPASVEKFANAPFEAKGQMVVDTKNISEEQLQVLFQKADKETQKRFLDWAKKNAK